MIRIATCASAALVLLTSCSEPVSTEAGVDVSSDVLVVQSSGLVFDSGTFSEPYAVPENFNVDRMSEGQLILTGNAPAASPGGITEGVSFKIPDALESEVSGQKVEVKLKAISASEGALQLRVAYSTNEVGNSGWKTFLIESSSDDVAFIYDVPLMKDGKGDFIGVDPMGNEIILEKIEVSVID